MERLEISGTKRPEEIEVVTMANEVVFQDNSEAIIAEIEKNVAAALEEIGGRAQTYAAAKAPIDTGALRNSITHKVVENEVYIGTNLTAKNEKGEAVPYPA